MENASQEWEAWAKRGGWQKGVNGFWSQTAADRERAMIAELIRLNDLLSKSREENGETGQ